ncbi:hypothetical protein [Treponema sp.]|uniref:hypothetical protein n=1 Tax=Treponema sp. TaxID=166 RepID=UPI0025CD4F12|nr:hypothetical protein [Treponema sp.]
MTFDNWTAYDEWLIANYQDYAIYKVNEVSGKIEIEYCAKDDFEKIKDEGK